MRSSACTIGEPEREPEQRARGLIHIELLVTENGVGHATMMAARVGTSYGRRGLAHV